MKNREEEKLSSAESEGRAGRLPKVRRAGDFDYSLNYEELDLRAQPELYRIGRGEQGVLMVQPYKGEILPHWRFRSVDVARQSAEQIMALYNGYAAAGDFPGMDMARKFLQMGYTRARRYANHAGGKKYASNPQAQPNAEAERSARKTQLLPQLPDWATSEKAQAAQVFFSAWQAVKNDLVYQAAAARWKAFERGEQSLPSTEEIRANSS